MSIETFPSNNIINPLFPQQLAHYSNTVPTILTWYTICDIAGKGVLHEIVGLHETSIDYMGLKITVDGVPNVIGTNDELSATDSTDKGFRDLTTFIHGSTSSNRGALIYNIPFHKSLKVEILHTWSGVADNLYGTVSYSLE